MVTGCYIRTTEIKWTKLFPLNNATAYAVHIIGDIGLNGHLSSRSVLGIAGAAMQVEVENYLQDQMKKVKQLLEANSDMVHALAAELMERDELLGDEVMEIVNQFAPKLTNDAKTKQKRIGFIRQESVRNSGTGLWTETDNEKEPVAAAEPLAATGTDNFSPVQAQPLQSTQAQQAQTTAFRVINDSPTQAPANTPVSNTPAAPSGQLGMMDRLGNPVPGNQVIPPANASTSFQSGVTAPFTPMWPSDQPTAVQPPKPAPAEPEAKAQPAAPTTADKPAPEQAKPTDTKQDKQDDEDLWDMLPKGW